MENKLMHWEKAGSAGEFVCPTRPEMLVPGVREKKAKQGEGKKDARRMENRGMDQQD